MCLETDLELRGYLINVMRNVLEIKGEKYDALDSLSKSLDLRIPCFGPGQL
jgi:hypothetical protein